MNTDPEEHVGSTEDSEIDQLLLAASQDYEAAAVSARETEEDDSSTNHRFGAPVTSTTVEEARKSGVPPKTRRQTSWACGVWSAWAKVRRTLPVVDPLEGNHELSEDIASMSIKALQFWLPKFVLEVRRQDKHHYPPDSLYSICSSLQRSFKFSDRADIKLLTDSKFKVL